MRQVRLTKPLKRDIDFDSLDLSNLTNLHRCALQNIIWQRYDLLKNVWTKYYLISHYKEQEHVFVWYQKLNQNAPFLAFLRQCSEQAEKINRFVETV